MFSARSLFRVSYPTSQSKGCCCSPPTSCKADRSSPSTVSEYMQLHTIQVFTVHFSDPRRSSYRTVIRFFRVFESGDSLMEERYLTREVQTQLLNGDKFLLSHDILSLLQIPPWQAPLTHFNLEEKHSVHLTAARTRRII